MPRDASGNYTLPAGNPVITGTTIESTWANPTMTDIATALTNSLSRNGEGGMLAPFQFADGTEGSPSITFTTEPTTGIHHPGSGDLRISVQTLDVVRFNTTNALEISTDGGTTWSTVATLLDAVRTNLDSTILENISVHGTLQDTTTTYRALSTAKAGDGFDGLLIGEDTNLPILKFAAALGIIFEGPQLTFDGTIVNDLLMKNARGLTGDNLAGDAVYDMIAVEADDIIYVGDVDAPIQLQGSAINLVSAVGDIVVVSTGAVTITAGTSVTFDADIAGGMVFSKATAHTPVVAADSATVDWRASNFARKAVAGASLTLTFTAPLLGAASLILKIEAAQPITSITYPVNMLGDIPTDLPIGINIFSLIYDPSDDSYFAALWSEADESVVRALMTTDGDGTPLKTNGMMTVVRDSTGHYSYTLVTPAPDAEYQILATVFALHGSGSYTTKIEAQTVNGFTLSLTNVNTNSEDEKHFVQALIY